MQANELKLKTRRKERKIVGRGGKKGTYCGRGNKGQKARSGGNVNPLFEGGRSTLIDHMKKKRGFKSRNEKQIIISLDKIEKKFKDGDIVNADSLIKSKLIGKISKQDKIKILGGTSVKSFSKKISIDSSILLSESVKASIAKAGGKIISDAKTSAQPAEKKLKKMRNKT